SLRRHLRIQDLVLSLSAKAQCVRDAGLERRFCSEVPWRATARAVEGLQGRRRLLRVRTFVQHRPAGCPSEAEAGDTEGCEEASDYIRFKENGRVHSHSDLAFPGGVPVDRDQLRDAGTFSGRRATGRWKLRRTQYATDQD